MTSSHGPHDRPLRALCLPGCGCRGAFQLGVLKRLWEAGERFDLVVGASSGAIAGAVLTAGLAAEGPDLFRSMARTPIVSRRYLKSERSPFGMGAIVREALRRFVPESRITQSETELVVSTTRAKRLLAGWLASAGRRLGLGRPGVSQTPAGTTLSYPFHQPSQAHALARRSDALVLHSNRQRTDMHNVIVASATIPVLYAKLAVLDGEVHVDGGASDNTLLWYLLARGVDDITVVSPYGGGAVSPTLFERTQTPKVPRGIKLRTISPAKTIRLRHFDFDPERLEEALQMPEVVQFHEPSEEPDRDPACEPLHPPPSSDTTHNA